MLELGLIHLDKKNVIYDQPSKKLFYSRNELV